MKKQKAIPQLDEQQRVVLPGTPEEQIAKERTKQVELNQVRAAQKAAGETGESTASSWLKTTRANLRHGFLAPS